MYTDVTELEGMYVLKKGNKFRFFTSSFFLFFVPDLQAERLVFYFDSAKIIVYKTDPSVY